MTPGTTTGPGENRENLGRRVGETTNHGEQVRHTRNECTNLTKNDASFKSLIEEYHQKGKTREQVKEEFKKRLKGLNKEKRDKMGIESAGDDTTDTEIEAFLTKTGCFDNQLMAQIEGDVRAREKANENMIDSCLEVTHDEYGNFDETELKKSLKKEGAGRLRTFLENAKYRKTYLSRLPGGNVLTEKSFSDINFDEISKAIGQLKPTDPKRAEIQEAWLKIAHVAHPDSNLASAFHAISHEGGAHVDIAGAYGAFFGDSNTCISRENREKILNFLVRQYTPVIPLSVLEVIDPKTSKKYLTSELDRAEIEKNLPSDPELAAALKKDREEEWEKTYKTYISGGKSMIGARSLPFETKIRILGQFGSTGKAEKMREYYKGKPNSLRSSTDTEEEFRQKFIENHSVDPEKLDIKAGLTEELIARLGHRVEGMEHFDAGCAMEWKTKNKEGEEITGYYIIDTIPGDTLDEENIITMRFLGDNRDPLSAGGLAHHYTGADFYDYLNGCAEDGKIIFRDRSEFDAEMEKNTSETKLPRYFTEAETKSELRAQFPEVVEVQNFDEFNAEVDKLLNPSNNHPKEAKNAAERTLHEGMIFCKTGAGGIDTFQIRGLDKDAGTITLWDGWGTGKKSIIEMPFADFLRTMKSMKQGGNEVYRVPTGGKKINTDVFNSLCGNKEQYADNLQKKMGRVSIREDNGHTVFGQFDEKTGAFTAMPVVKIGDKKDLYIESIDGATVTYRVGAFTQGVSDKEKGTWKKKPGFRGSPPLTMNLEMLWAYLQNHGNFSLDKPLDKPEMSEEKGKTKPMGWWNIFMHSHSLGVLLHGDLWKAPFKAWEEQHHKDHAFHGKLTAALAIEKLQSGYGPVSGLLNWAEWPSLMVADGNGSFQSYLDELVNKIDGMGSYHRTRLIKKWAHKEHFPSPKFMAAMFASMKIFGQLYPYDFDGDGYENLHDDNKKTKHEWVWYNSINHSLGHKYPHMPPHHGEAWPEKWTKEGFKMNEIDVCFEMFAGFQHPMLKNLGRRFQKYMNAGQKELADGGEGNLKQRTTMTEKLDWMMGAAVSQKLPELFGASTELWLTEGYPTHVTTMPYAAVLFGHREEQMLSPTREHIKTQFQSGYHIPMFVFMQNRDLGDTFRETGIAFAYTISEDCGKRLEKLTREAADNRLSGRNKSWRSRFEDFWKEYGTNLMHKMTGMRDPMLNLMMSDPALFDKLLEKQPSGKRKQYERLREKKSVMNLYYQRIAKDTYGDAVGHAEMKRGEGYYAGDHFRYRKGFETGIPISWMNWSNYLDSNLTDAFASGSSSRTGDGVFWEIKGFLSDIPELATKIAKDMGYSEDDAIIKDIAQSLYEKNIAEMRKETQSKFKPENIAASYATMFAMMFELVEPKRIKGPGDGPKETARNEKYFEQIKACLNKAKEIEKGPGGFPAAIAYRAKVAASWEKIVDGVIETDKLSLEDIEEGRFHGGVGIVKENTQARSGEVLKDKKDEHDERVRLGREKEPNNIVPFPGASQQRNQENDERREAA